MSTIRTMTFSGVIEAIGVPEFARATNTTESHVRVMKTRNSIPPEYWDDLIDEATRRGLKEVTYRRLVQLRQSRFNNRKSMA